MKTFLLIIFFAVFGILFLKNGKSVFAGSEILSFASGSSVTTQSGFVGDTTFTVYLTNGISRAVYTIYWDSTSTGTTVNLGTCTVLNKGTTCSLAITIPHSSKGNWLIHSNSSGSNGANTLTFTVGPKITNSTPSTGAYQTSVTVSGTGFASEAVTAKLGTYTLGSATPTSGTSGVQGDLTVTAGAPAMPIGSKAVSATGSTSGNISSSFTFTMSPSINLTSSSGRWGSTTTVTGYGFAASSNITVLQDGSLTATTGGPTDANGSFTNIVYTPTDVAGAHTISARDASINTSPTVSYTMSPVITLSSLSGNPGASTNVSGNGFAGSSTITIWQDGSSTATTGGPTNSTGSFTNISYVPTGSVGTHTINARDASSNSALDINYAIGGALTMNNTSSTSLSVVTLQYPNPTSTGSLGTIQVADSRGTNVGWSVTGSTTNFGQVNSAVLVSGSHNTVTSGGSYDYASGGVYTLTITNGGQSGNAIFSVSGLESATNQTTGSNVAVGTRGVTATFATANYSIGDSWTITINVIPVNISGYFTVNPNNATFAVISGSGTGVGAGSSHAFTSNTDTTTLMSATAGNGTGTYSINPSLSLIVPAGTYSGNYSATFTETVQ